MEVGNVGRIIDRNIDRKTYKQIEKWKKQRIDV